MSSTFKRPGDLSGYSNYRAWCYNNDLVPLSLHAFNRCTDFNDCANQTFENSGFNERMSSRMPLVLRRPSTNRGAGTMAKRKQSRTLMIAAARTGPMRAPPAAFYGAQHLRGGELKTVDVVPASMLMSSTPVFTLLNTCQQGAAFYNRIGNRIQMRSVHITGSIANNAVVPTGQAHYIRFMVVYDRSPAAGTGVGSYPAIGTLLADYDTNGTVTTTSVSGVNPNFTDRFVIIRDQRFYMPNDSNTALTSAAAGILDYTDTANINLYCKLKGLEAQYSASTGAIGDLSTGALWVLVYGNIPAASCPYSANWKSRLRYYD